MMHPWRTKTQYPSAISRMMYPRENEQRKPSAADGFLISMLARQGHRLLQIGVECGPNRILVFNLFRYRDHLCILSSGFLGSRPQYDAALRSATRQRFSRNGHRGDCVLVCANRHYFVCPDSVGTADYAASTISDRIRANQSAGRITRSHDGGTRGLRIGEEFRANFVHCGKIVPGRQKECHLHDLVLRRACRV